MRVIYRGFKITGLNQFTADLLGSEAIVEKYGLKNIVLEFSNTQTKTLNVLLDFLFEEPANDFSQKYDLIISSDLQLTNLPANVGTIIDMDYVFDSEQEFLEFEANFIHNQVFQIKPKS